MHTASALALTGFIAWALSLLVLMEVLRVRLVLIGANRSDEFTPDNRNLSPFMQRLARAHANCLEGLPLFGGLLVVALVTERQSITDPLALWLLAARIVQSTIHLVSVQPLAVNLRFAAFAAQMVIGTLWAAQLLQS